MLLPTYPRGMTRLPVSAVPAGMRVSERTFAVPERARDQVVSVVRSWEFKRRAGFDVPADSPRPDEEIMIAKRLCGVWFREPVRIVWADDTGFGYETRPGHPVYGEESFLLGTDGVFTARSVSRPATALWWMLAPMLWTMQWWTHRKYTRIVQAIVATAS